MLHHVPLNRNRLPLWLKIVYTCFVVCLVGFYAHAYPFSNFLWFCDIALISTVFALWLENALLAGMMLLSVGLVDLAWDVSLITQILGGHDHIRLAGYMFEQDIALYVRALSLFHLFLPPMLVWMVWKLGYDRRSWLAMTLLMIADLLIVYFFIDPKENVNWVFGTVKGSPQEKIRPVFFLLIVMGVLALVVYLPTHVILLLLFRNPRKKGEDHGSSDIRSVRPAGADDADIRSGG